MDGGSCLRTAIFLRYKEVLKPLTKRHLEICFAYEFGINFLQIGSRRIWYRALHQEFYATKSFNEYRYISRKDTKIKDPGGSSDIGRKEGRLHM